MIPGNGRLSVARTPLTAVRQVFLSPHPIQHYFREGSRVQDQALFSQFRAPISAKIHKKQKVAFDVFPFHATQTVVEIRQGNKGIELGTTFLNYRNFRLPIWKLHFNFLISLTLTLSFVVVALVLFFQGLNKYIFRIINKNL